MPREKIIENENLIKIWNTEKNNQLGYNPEILTCGSNKIVWWCCSNGHEYQMSIHKKLRNPKSCPICSGHRTIAGINDFETCYPEIAKEWHPTLNGNLKPSSISKQNGKKVWWQCEYGHEWQATPHDRVGSETGCPICNKRRLTSFPEQAIMFYIKKLYPDAINKYTEIFSNKMELDIYIPSIKVGIEFDGANWHKTQAHHMREREKFDICRRNNIFLIRVKEKNNTDWGDVADHIWYINKKEDDLEQVISAIIYSIDRKENMWSRKTKESYISNIDINITRDKNKIKKYLTPIQNSLAQLKPELILDWDYNKNKPLIPEMFGINSNDIVWWKCHICNHEWKTAIIHRGGKKNSGCPECAKLKRGKAFTKTTIAKKGSLKENNLEIAREWHPTLNNNLKVSDITASSPKLVWWLCSKCQHEWRSSSNNRAKGSGCPCCSGRVPKIGVNDLKTINPALAKEWNYNKNGALKPESFLPKSGKKVWWLCSHCGYEWEKEIRARTNGSPCPNCKYKLNTK